ncbi:MAG: hypothetical protein ACI33P_13190 [Lysinibacillus sp.]
MGIVDVERLCDSLVLDVDGKKLQKKEERNIRQAVERLMPMKGTPDFLQRFSSFKQGFPLPLKDAGDMIGLTYSGKTAVRESITANNAPVRAGIDRSSDGLTEAGDDGNGLEYDRANEFSLDSRTVKTSESIQTILRENGYTVDEFLALLQPHRLVEGREMKQINAIREQIGIPPKGTIMAKVIPQSDLYHYLYNENYNGIRGFTAVREHSENLITLADYYEGARLDYHHTAFKIMKGVDGVSRSDGSPDRYYGTIEYKLEEPGRLVIPRSDSYPGSYPYTGTGFTASKEIVLPEYYQEPRRFMDGDVLYIKDSETGKAVCKFIYDEVVESWVKMK